MAAGVVLFIFTFSYGAPLIAPVALKAIAADLGSTRSVPALANALAWLGSGAGAMAFGWIAERFGKLRPVRGANKTELAGTNSTSSAAGVANSVLVGTRKF